MKPEKPADPHAVLREAVGGNRLLGVVMIFLGAMMFVPVALEFPRQRISEIILAVSASFFLLAPGILYQIAAFGMVNREQQAGRMSRYVAIGQAIPSLLILPVIAIGQFRGAISTVFVPLIANLFFVPAALVQAWKISRAIDAIRLLPTTGRAFEAIPVQPIAMPLTQPTDADDQSPSLEQ